MYERIKNYLLDDSQSYVVKSTILKRPRFFLVGWLYILAIFVILIVGIEFLDLGTVLSPLALLEPITKFFIDVETGNPRNILGWVYIAACFVVIILSFFGLMLPGFYVALQWEKVLDKEWPDNPEKTKEWRDRHAKK